MDWSRTKTIFIVVFSILNVFLMSLYVDRYNESIGLQSTLEGSTSFEERLAADSITVPRLTNMPTNVAYVSGTVHNFTPEELGQLPNADVRSSTDGILEVELVEPVSVEGDITVESVVQEHAHEGQDYKIWSTDSEMNTALLFQQVNDRSVYHNSRAFILVRWNEEGEVTGFTQTYLEDLEDYNEERSLITYMSAIEVLYNRSLILPGAEVTEVSLGYSTLAQLGETQVFSPTWAVKVELADGTMEEYFVNAIDSRILDIPIDAVESEDTEE